MKRALQVIDRVRAILGSKAGNEYNVVGYEQFPQDAANYRLKNRTVRVFYSEGEILRSTGKTQAHAFKIDLEMCVSAEAESDLDTLANAGATQAQLAAALASTRPSAQQANDQYDEFATLLYEELTDPANFDLGIQEKWLQQWGVKRIKKDRLLPYGENAVVSGVISIEAVVHEQTVSSVRPTNRVADTLTLKEG